MSTNYKVQIISVTNNKCIYAFIDHTWMQRIKSERRPWMEMHVTLILQFLLKELYVCVCMYKGHSIQMELHTGWRWMTPFPREAATPTAGRWNRNLPLQMMMQTAWPGSIILIWMPPEISLQDLLGLCSPAKKVWRWYFTSPISHLNKYAPIPSSQIQFTGTSHS